MMEDSCIIKFVDGSKVVIRNIDTYKVNMGNGLVTVEAGELRTFSTLIICSISAQNPAYSNEEKA